MGYKHESFYAVEEDEVYKGDSMQMTRPNQYGPTGPNNFTAPPHQGGYHDGSSYGWNMDKPSHGASGSNQYQNSRNMDKPSHCGSSHGWNMDKPSHGGSSHGWNMDKPSHGGSNYHQHDGWKMDRPSHDGWNKPSYGAHKAEYTGDMSQFKVGGGGYHSTAPHVPIPPLMAQTAPVNQYHNNCRPDPWNFKGIDD